jgi:methionine aminotransferase
MPSTESTSRLTLPRKHSAADTTIFTVMSGLATQYGAINLSQGFPDFPVDERLGHLLHRAVQQGANQYAPMPGLPALRQAISTDFERRYGLQVNPDREITITPGATYAIYTAFATILEPGDDVIVMEPAYDSYIPNIEMCGARAVPVKLSAPDFRPNWQLIRAALTPRTKAIIVNTPHNPTGAVWAEADWQELSDLALENDLFVLSDEVYEQLIFDGVPHHSVLQQESLRPRAFALFSFGKVFHNTGWKMGYCIAPPELTSAFRRVHQFLAFSVNTPAQTALAAYLEQTDRAPVSKMMEEKRDLFLQLMQESRFQFLKPSEGSYFQLASFKSISDLGDHEFAEWLTKEHGVATIPISAFYSDRQDDKLIRFCFAKKEETLREAAERLRNL